MKTSKEIDSNQTKGKVLQINKGTISFTVKKGNYDGSWEAVLNDRWESHTFTIFDRFLDKEYSYIDIGAWIGPTVLYGSQLARNVYAIEPDPVAHAELMENIRLNLPSSKNIRLFQVCIAPESGEIKFGNRKEWGNSRSSIFFGDQKTARKIKGLDFESFIKSNNIEECNFIKMDIEGGEYIVIESMKNYLQNNRPTLYLSLHPKILGRPLQSELPEFINSFKRRILRFSSTLKIINCLSGYRYLYDVTGTKLSKLKLLFTSIRGKTFSIIATDHIW